MYLRGSWHQLRNFLYLRTISEPKEKQKMLLENILIFSRDVQESMCSMLLGLGTRTDLSFPGVFHKLSGKNLGFALRHHFLRPEDFEVGEEQDGTIFVGFSRDSDPPQLQRGKRFSGESALVAARWEYPCYYRHCGAKNEKTLE